MNVPADPCYTWDNEIGAFTGMELIPESPMAHVNVRYE